MSIVKPLEWHGPDLHGEYYAKSILGLFEIGFERKDGTRWAMGDYHESLEAAQEALNTDYERRILAVLDPAFLDRVKQLEEALRDLADAARSATDARKHTALINALENADALLNGGSNERD